MLLYLFFDPHRISGLARKRICLSSLPTYLDALFQPCAQPILLRHSISQTLVTSTGISTCCPSTTLFSLALGPDLPRADQLYPGNLRYSAGRILTFLSLLIPAFSLLTTPLLLSVQLLRNKNAPLPMYHYIPKLRCCVLAPDIFGAGPLD